MDDRIELSATSAALFVGDLAAIAAFVVAGEFRHFAADQALARAPETLLPFLVGWLLVAPVAGAYARGVGARLRPSVLTVAAAWVGAALIGQALRATRYVSGGFDPVFVAVSLLVGAALLVAWRIAAAYALAR